MTPIEAWKSVVGYEGLYEVSSIGNVRSLERFVDNGNGGHIQRGRILKASINSAGYRTLKLCKNGCIQKQVSRLVATAFITNPHNKKEVNHISGIKTQDNVENLEWVTPSENLEHAKQTGLNKNFGEGHCKSLVTEEQVKEIRRRFIPYVVTGNQLASEYGLARQSVYAIIHNRRWKRTK